MVFQFPESQLFEDTVEKEIEFGPKNFNMNVQEVKNNAFDMLLELGFHEMSCLYHRFKCRVAK